MVVIPLLTPVAEPELVQKVVPLSPALPERVKLIAPFGATAFALPVATAVKVMVPSRVGVPVVVSATVGVARPTTVDGSWLVTAPTEL